MPKTPRDDSAVEATDGPTATPEELARAIAEQSPRRPGSDVPQSLDEVLAKANEPPEEPPAKRGDAVAQARAAAEAKRVPTAADLVVKELPPGYREHVEYQTATGKWAAGYTPRGETEAIYLGDDFRSKDEAVRAVRNDAANKAAF